MLRRIAFAFVIALVLALPALLPERWLSGGIGPFITLCTLPGSLCGLLFGGRFFPPEGYIGQSLPHWMLMVVVQTFVWLVILSCVRFIAIRSRKNHSDGARSI
jgi:hypothetical protein